MRSRSVSLALALLALSACGVVGCASRARVADHPPAATRSVRMAMPAPGLARYEASPWSTPRSARFEFGRRDGLVSARQADALRATRQWPQAAQPAERPVRFRRWEQR